MSFPIEATCREECLKHVLDEAFENHHCRCEEPKKKTISLFQFIKGVYYLTLAKFTNPIAHEFAWLVLRRLQTPPQQQQQQPQTMSIEVSE